MIRFVKDVFQALWKTVNFLRRACVNLVFLMILGLMLGTAAFLFHTPEVPEGAILVVPLEGSVVESGASAAKRVSLTRLMAGTTEQTQLRDVIEVIDRAAKDKRISGLLMRLDDLQSIGMASIHEIGLAMDRYKATGRRITVWSGGFSQRQYAVAAHASDLYLHPMGQVLLTGIGSSRLYWGELLKKAGVTVHVFKAGAYKTFPEAYVRNGPSAESLKADHAWMDDAWAQMQDSIQMARGLLPGAVSGVIESLPKLLKDSGGDLSAVALKANLVDGLKTRDEVNNLLLERQGGKKGDLPKTIDYRDYLAALTETDTVGKYVAVVTLEGEIRDGESGVSGVGDRTMASDIRTVRQDPNAAALVLRVNSPGGSAVASEMIRRELELVREAGKPVIVSMGDYAASGGYWVSLAADKIVADPVTVTGSIGVFGMMPTFEKSLEKLSVGTGGVSTTWLAKARDATQPMDPRFEEVMSLTVDRTYRNFIHLVAEARKLPQDRVAELAQGRVYTGRQAKTLGLVDELGGLETAITLAKQKAGLPAAAEALWVEPPMSMTDVWAERLLSKAVAVSGVKATLQNVGRTLGVTPAMLSAVPDVTALTALPTEPVAHCLCSPN